MVLSLFPRRDLLEEYTVTIECGPENEYDGRLGVRISAIFVIMAGSLIGAVGPIILARLSGSCTQQHKSHQSSRSASSAILFAVKYFGSGIIIATAFIHLLAPAVEALGSPCISEDGPYGAITSYSWPEGIALMMVFAMFFVELVASRFGIPGFVTGMNGQENRGEDVEKDGGNNQEEPERSNNITLNTADADHLSHARTHTPADQLAAQLTAIFILEFGVLFHSIFIGLTLAVSGDEFTVLYIVLVFHQTFEGLGLGSRLATATWPAGRGWVPYVLAVAYGLSTPVAIAAGLGVRESLTPGSEENLVINGVFDSISAGILLYTGLVELMAHEFLFSEDMRKRRFGVTMGAFGWMVLGAGLMALLGNWA